MEVGISIYKIYILIEDLFELKLKNLKDHFF